MQYLLLIYGNEESFGKMSKAEQDGVLQEYGEFTKSIAQSGHYRGSNELAAISTATTMHLTSGGAVLQRSIGGPFNRL